ncbi:3-oxoacyl-[acyl-carrier-protein] synthase, mitochondrial [Parasteatoda tepidariorum]|uniref:3-oxoacyl-[acyl-carrier-protein] synthase, mitochondrial n=1 Tax=Parasteatoda tepidariorum TaxID=114398 RepID=UPI001C723162|nr:3-oxoacyl-[acyl-carrier-protein] synthase, mitochondrial-like [Parasteatoda tepidariorum]
MSDNFRRNTELRMFHSILEINFGQRVVVTGLGIVSPLGVGVHHVWQRLLDGKTGTVPLLGDDYKDIPCKVAAFVQRGNDPGCLDRHLEDADFKKMSLTSIYALIAANEALKDAKWCPVSTDALEKTGVAVGTGMVDLMDIVTTGNKLHHSGYSKISPFFVPRILSNMPAGHIAIKYGFKGPNHSVSTACATGLHAIGDAYNFIKNKYASVMVCGSSEAVISPLSIAGFCRMRALSTHFNSKPEEASRPFDSERDGFVMGEGAGILVLESLDHAIERGAKIYAEILGYGLSGDAYHITSPGNGAFRSMRQALSLSNIDTSQIGYINAHATSTPLGDSIELKAIHELFKEHSEILTVSSTKGATGHLLGAAGSVEAIFTILACYSESIPPNINLKCLDSEWPVNVAGNHCETWPHQVKEKRIALTNSFGFGGTNASLVFSNF